MKKSRIIGVFAVFAVLVCASPVRAAFPIIETTSINGLESSDTEITITLPTGIVSGDLIIVSASIDGTPTTTWDSGYTEIFSEIVGSGGTGLTFESYFRRADGTEGATIVLTLSFGQGVKWACYRISGHHTTSDPEATSAEDAVGDANPNPPSHTATWGAEDNLWIALYSWDDGTSHTSYPTDYDSNQLTESWTDSNGTGIAIATDEVNASAEDPDTATIGASAIWAAATMVIRPAAAAGGIGITGPIVITGPIKVTE